ncbi:MAG: hypothetical protein ACXV3S_10820, partial [Kineosporiaceae bacterium]
ATVADGAVLIVRHGRSSRDDLELAVQALAAVNARLLGTVLNFIPQRRRGYGYGYGYGDQPAKAKTTRRDKPSRSSRAQVRAKANARRKRHLAGHDEFRIDIDSLLAHRQAELTTAQPVIPAALTAVPTASAAAPPLAPGEPGPQVQEWFQANGHGTGDGTGHVPGRTTAPDGDELESLAGLHHEPAATGSLNRLLTGASTSRQRRERRVRT